MIRARSHQQPKQKGQAVEERKRSTTPPKTSPDAAGSSYSSSSSPGSSLWSQSSAQSTRASTLVTIQQDPRTEFQFVQHAPDSSSNAVTHVTIGVPGHTKIVVSIENGADQQPIAIQNSVKPLKVEEKPDKVQAVSETEAKAFQEEFDSLREKVNSQESQLQELTSELKYRDTKIEQQNSEIREAHEEIRGANEKIREANEKIRKANEEIRKANKETAEIAESNDFLREGINNRVCEVMEFFEKHAIGKEVFEKWRDTEMPDDNSIVSKDLIERQKEIYSFLMEGYDRLEQMRSKDQHRLRELTDEVAEVRAKNDNARQRIEQLEGQNRTLLDGQAAREREIRVEVEQERAAAFENARQQITQLEDQNRTLLDGQAAREQEIRVEVERERAAEIENARQQITQLQGEIRTSQAARERETREQAALVRAAQDQVAEVQARVETLQTQLDETQQQNNALLAQRQDDVELIVVILGTQQLQENIWADRFNELLLQRNMTMEDYERLVQAHVETVNRNEDEVALVLCQMTEIIDSTPMPEAEDNTPGRSQPSNNPRLQLVRRGSQLQSEILTPDGRWQQTAASRHAQQLPNCLAGATIRGLLSLLT